MTKLLPKCPRCFSEARVYSGTVRDMDKDLPCHEHWVACVRCDFRGDPATTRAEAVQNWSAPQSTKKEEVPGDEEDELSIEDHLKTLINILQDISKSLKTIATKR